MSKLEVELKLQIIDESRWNDLVDYLKGMNDIVPGSIVLPRWKHDILIRSKDCSAKWAMLFVFVKKKMDWWQL